MLLAEAVAASAEGPPVVSAALLVRLLLEATFVVVRHWEERQLEQQLGPKQLLQALAW